MNHGLRIDPYSDASFLAGYCVSRWLYIMALLARYGDNCFVVWEYPVFYRYFCNSSVKFSIL